MKGITNIHVDCVNYNGSQAAAGWDHDGARFHVWFNPKTLRINDPDSPTIYKNPPRHIKHREPGDFRTRHLDGKAANNAKILAFVFEQIGKQDLVNKALQAKAEKDREEQARRDESHRLWLIEQASAQLYAAAKLTLQSFAYKPDHAPEWYSALADAVEAAEKKPETKQGKQLEKV